MSWIRSAPVATAVLALAAAGCVPAQLPSAGPSASSSAPGIRALAADYLAIAGPANHRLDVEVSSYQKNARRDLAAAIAALRAQAATERRFDRQLAAIPFPPAVAATAAALIAVNEIRARLTDQQAAVTSMTALAALAGRHKAADAEVEAQVRVIRAELGLPPPESS
jgi:aminopeptidase N